jgi:cytochrome c oxidase cbb3-type subunit I
VDALHPYFIIRATGGTLFVIGGLIMAYNVWRTIRGDTITDLADQPRVAAAPGLRAAPAE